MFLLAYAAPQNSVRKKWQANGYVYITTPSSTNSLWLVFVNWGVDADIMGSCASPAHSVTLSAVFFFYDKLQEFFFPFYFSGESKGDICVHVLVTEVSQARKISYLKGVIPLCLQL